MTLHGCQEELHTVWKPPVRFSRRKAFWSAVEELVVWRAAGRRALAFIVHSLLTRRRGLKPPPFVVTLQGRRFPLSASKTAIGPHRSHAWPLPLGLLLRAPPVILASLEARAALCCNRGVIRPGVCSCLRHAVTRTIRLSSFMSRIAAVFCCRSLDAIVP